MELKDILSVGLTAEDFETIIEGLDAIPEKGMAAELMSEIMTALIIPASRQQEHKAKVMAIYREREKKVEGRKDDLTLLKSKIILLKRLLAENAAMEQVNSILTPPR